MTTDRFTTALRQLRYGTVACALALLLTTACSLPSLPGQTPAAVPTDAAAPDSAPTDAAQPPADSVPTATPIALTAIEGITWRLLTLNGQPLDADGITLIFGSQQVGGSSGCNSYSANFTLSGDTLTMGPIAGTAMACERGMQAESSYLAALQSAGRLSLGGEQLTLATAQGDLLFAKVEPVADSSLAGDWALGAFSAGATATSLLSGTAVTANFADGVISGSAGCNQYSGNYTLNGDTIRFSPIATTRVACAPEVNAQEQTFLNALATAGQLQIAGDRLLINHADGTLQFVRVLPPVALELPNTQWMLTGADDAALLPPAETPITLRFEADQLGGVSGCNNYGGSYSVDGVDLRVGELVQTAMACDAALMALEAAYLDALRAATVARRDGELLVIAYAGGELRFSPASGDTGGAGAAPTPLPEATVTPTESAPTGGPQPGESLAAFSNYRVDITYPPLRAVVVLTGEFPDDCTRFTRSEQLTDPDGTIRYNVYVVRPADAACNRTRTPFEQAFDLDISDLRSGSYTIVVNGAEGTFRLNLGD